MVSSDYRGLCSILQNGVDPVCRRVGGRSQQVLSEELPGCFCMPGILAGSSLLCMFELVLSKSWLRSRSCKEQKNARKEASRS